MNPRLLPHSALLALAISACSVKEQIDNTAHESLEAQPTVSAGELTSVSDPQQVSSYGNTLADETASSPAEPNDSTAAYEAQTEIDFEGVEIGGALVEPESLGVADVLDFAEDDVGAVQSQSMLNEMMGRQASGLATRGYGRGARASAAEGSPAPSAPRTSSARRRAEVERGPDPTPIQDHATNTEQYTHYGFNDMTQTSADAFSTFGIDVDTASYAISRRKLESGQMPDHAAVRVEEFINALPYDYATPVDDAPFAVHMEAAPHPFQDGHHVLRVGIKGMEVDADERRPVHLTFLVDTSGSMRSPDKMGLVKRSLHYLVNQLEDGDTVALATYAGSVQRVLSPTAVGHSNRIHRAIDNLTARGSTAMNSGIQLAYDMAWDSYERGEENRVIVLSDGDANVGPSSHTDILSTIRDYSNRGITLSTIGFGMGNYKDTMMEQLANQGDGNYYYIDRYEEAQKVFGERLAGTLQTIARDVKIQVEFNPEAVLSYRLIGYENRDIADRDFRNDRVDAGEIGAGHTVTALYEVVLAEGAGSELATVRLRNKVPGPDRPAVEWSTPFSGNYLHKRFSRASDNFKMAFCAGTFAELLRNSPYAAEIDYADLADLLETSMRSRVSEDTELLGLVQIAERLSGGRGVVAQDW